MKLYLRISRILFVLDVAFLVAYLSYFSGVFTHPLRVVSVTGMIVIALNGFIAENSWDRFKEKHSVVESGFDRILDVVCSIPVWLAMLPIIILNLAENSGRYDIKKRFAFLVSRGYEYSSDGGVHYFHKGDTVIKILQDYEYKISYDGGESYVDVTATTLGTKFERDQLIRVMAEYSAASLEDKRRGKTVDTAYYFVKFIRAYVK